MIITLATNKNSLKNHTAGEIHLQNSFTKHGLWNQRFCIIFRLLHQWGNEVQFQLLEGGPLPTTYLCNAGRAGRDDLYAPSFASHWLAWNFYFQNWLSSFSFFPRNFIITGEKPLPDKVLETEPQVKLIGRGLSEVSLKLHWVWTQEPFLEVLGLQNGLYQRAITTGFLVIVFNLE